MNNENTGKSKNRRFQRPGLIFYCYLLIPLNELAQNILIINNLKNGKKIIDISMVSIHFAGNAVLVRKGFRFVRAQTGEGATPIPLYLYTSSPGTQTGEGRR
jgi:hypothetical protein